MAKYKVVEGTTITYSAKFGPQMVEEIDEAERVKRSQSTEADRIFVIQGSATTVHPDEYNIDGNEAELISEKEFSTRLHKRLNKQLDERLKNQGLQKRSQTNYKKPDSDEYRKQALTKSHKEREQEEARKARQERLAANPGRKLKRSPARRTLSVRSEEEDTQTASKTSQSFFEKAPKERGKLKRQGGMRVEEEDFELERQEGINLEDDNFDLEEYQEAPHPGGTVGKK